MIRDLEQLRTSLVTQAGRVARLAEESRRTADEMTNPATAALHRGMQLARQMEVDHLERLIDQCDLAIATQRERRRGSASVYLATARRHNRRAAGDRSQSG